MYAIVDIAGKQFRVSKNQHIYTHQLDQHEGDSITFDSVLLLHDGKEIHVGAPLVEKAKISGRIVTHEKGDKVLVYKKKRRKGYEKLNGHRQQYTKVLIEDIIF